MLKTCYRQYQQYSKVQTMLKNNLISLLDTAFPDANRLFTSPPRADGSEKWVDFVAAFGIASASVACLRRPLPPSTRSGAKARLQFQQRQGAGYLCLILWSLRCHAENGYSKTFW